MLGKSKLNGVEVSSSKALIDFDSNISHDEFVLIDHVPKKFDDIKKEVKKSNDK